MKENSPKQHDSDSQEKSDEVNPMVGKEVILTWIWWTALFLLEMDILTRIQKTVEGFY